MRTVKKLGAALAILTCLSMGSGEAFAQHFKAFFFIILPDLDSFGGFGFTGSPAVGKALVNVKNGKVQASAETWVFNDSFRKVKYEGISGLYFATRGVPDRVLAAMVCDYSVKWDGTAKWSGKVARQIR